MTINENLGSGSYSSETAGLHLKQSKCAFLLPAVVSGAQNLNEGLQPTEEKVRAIKEAPPPSNVSQLCSFLGLVNYYSKFLPNLANTLAPCIVSYRKPSNGHGKPHSKQLSKKQRDSWHHRTCWYTLIQVRN